MSKRTTVLAAALLGTAAGLASAQSPTLPDREPAVMLYFNKSFGGSTAHRSSSLALGLRLDQTSTLAYTPGRSMFDARWSLSGRTTLAAMGMPMFDSSLEGRRWFADFGSSGLPPYASWMLGAAMVGGGMCLAEWVLCEDDSDDEDSDYTPPSTGRLE